jgi:flagellar motility protein MotE (MotC chaperone)
MSIPAFPATWRGRLFGPRLGLPLMALGLAALLPGRLAGLAELWPAQAAPTVAASALPSAPLPPLRPVSLRDGVVAVPRVSDTLAGPARPSPLGEDRPGEGRLLLEVGRRQAEVEQRERAVELREARVRAAEGLARNQIADLSRLREEMERLVVREGSAAEADIDALVALYVNMRPQQAAKVLDKLEAPRAATILLKIPERQAGPILANMEPLSALAVTQEIAGRRDAFRTTELRR